MLGTNAFKEIRETIEFTATKESMDRISTFTENETDCARALQTVVRLRNEHYDALVSNLTWPERIFHHTIERFERTLAVVGIAGVLFGGTKGFRGVHGMAKACMDGKTK